MFRYLPLYSFIFLYFISSFLTLSSAQPYPSFFTERDLNKLEHLITIAQSNDLELLQLENDLAVLAELDIQGRLSQALTITTGANLRGDFYNQATPSYNISVSLDVMKLLEAEDDSPIRIQLAKTAQQIRIKVVEAFVNYHVATLTAETSARALEAAEAAFQVETTRLQAGETILSSKIKAQSDVATATLNLYTANGNVIISLERLAAAVGLSPAETAQVLRSNE
jgi:hypothetical protein